MTSSTIENWRKIGQILGSYILSHGGPEKHDGRREEALKNNRGGGVVRIDQMKKLLFNSKSCADCKSKKSLKPR